MVTVSKIHQDFWLFVGPKNNPPPAVRPGLSIVEATLRFDTFRGEKSSEPARLPEMRRGGKGRDFDGDFLGLFPNVPNGKSMKSTLFWVPLRNGDDVSWENIRT